MICTCHPADFTAKAKIWEKLKEKNNGVKYLEGDTGTITTYDSSWRLGELENNWGCSNLKMPKLATLSGESARYCEIWFSVDFAVPADNRINLKESEKKEKYLDLARELKKLWNMNVTIVPIVIGALGTITKGLLKCLEDLEIGGRVETIQTTALLRTARILRRVQQTWGD